MLKILYTIGSLGLGGAESQIVQLIRELKKRGWHSELFVLEACGPLRQVLESDGVTVHDGGYDSTSTRWRKILQLARAFFHLWFIALRTKPGVLHAYLPLTSFLGSLAGRISGIPRIITSRRALGTHQDRHPLWKPFDRAANMMSHYVTVNSRAVGNDAMARDRVDPKKLCLIPNGIDAVRFERAAVKRETMRNAFGLDARSVGVVVVGNLLPYKGHADLLHALPHIANGKPATRYFLVGEDRGIGAGLMRMAKELGVSEQVIFLGRREDVAEIMAAMDIFVMPSHEEGFSNALLEAMASGLAVVATDVGGNPEALEDGNLGILVPPHNPAALAAAINCLLADGDARLKLGARAKKAMSTKYTVAAMVDAHVALYQQ